MGTCGIELSDITGDKRQLHNYHEFRRPQVLLNALIHLEEIRVLPLTLNSLSWPWFDCHQSA